VSVRDQALSEYVDGDVKAGCFRLDEGELMLGAVYQDDSEELHPSAFTIPNGPSFPAVAQVFHAMFPV
jgi:hypothetical protein